ncbi:uncharacterized protein GGS22DRAFT_136141 [Annulohypoxylon maeteangense]|uniref:uncharacterized protein n=1 Tax=Annulohypoxylon maeteangense TaxID=1927788 RepID=UPI0020074A36|nr:uncharacterized protein GGS22DRAFT_136141 [Annulohypoxylon maeteangense]KAI0885929.1 hypothetical protein GGS22DRAFT_136141 [Annulohypoxylon maeteangense]
MKMSRTASAFAELLQSSLSSRTVYVKCIPSPVTFFERRSVLRAVQKLSFETIDTFKKLEDNSSFIVVTSKPDAAAALVNASPVTRVVVAQDPNAAGGEPTTSSWGAEYDVRGSITAPIDPIPPSRETESTPALKDLGISYITFTLHMFAANRAYNHLDAIKKNPLHGPWPSSDGDEMETFRSAALRQCVPAGAMAPALRDWDTANQLLRDSTSFSEEGVEGASTTLLGKQRLKRKHIFILERIRNRQNRNMIPAIMRSLAAFADGTACDKPPLVDPLPQKTLPGKTDDWAVKPELTKSVGASIYDAPHSPDTRDASDAFNDIPSDLEGLSLNSIKTEIEEESPKG